jgi:hypothetical protein
VEEPAVLIVATLDRLVGPIDACDETFALLDVSTHIFVCKCERSYLGIGSETHGSILTPAELKIIDEFQLHIIIHFEESLSIQINIPYRNQQLLLARCINASTYQAVLDTTLTRSSSTA